MAIQTIKATIQMRQGNEEDFNPDKMTSGEWAVSKDTTKVWMCFRPGFVLRMATYEAFEEDMKQIQLILATCEDIQVAVEQFEKLAEQHESRAELYSIESQSWAVGGTNTRTGENTDNSKYYSEQAKSSASTATTKASVAATSATNAANSASTATAKASEASTSAATATSKASAASTSATNAKTSETNAKTSETNAASSASIATAKASAAATSATHASNSATEAESYAHGGTGTRENEDIDNAKYYYEQSKSISGSFAGALRPMGTVTFANLPAVANAVEGDMYNISDQFTTTSAFKEGSGLTIPAGSNVYKTADGYWDVLAGSPVTGVKGNAESSYRKGNVNLTKENIGLGNVPDVKTNDQTPTFTQATSRTNIGSGEKLSVILGKIAKWFSDLKTVAFTGSYSDLTNKPTIPAAVAVKGNAESSYRTGNVNITPANIGAVAEEEKINFGYGTCSTAAATAAKEVTIINSENWELKTGSEVVVKFSYTNTAQNPTLNVNGTGAKRILYNTAIVSTSSLAYAGTANRYIRYIFDGTQYVFMGWSIDANNTYTPASLGGGYGTCSTAAATVAKAATLSGYSLVTGGIVSVKFAYDVPAGATLNINSKGAKAIYYRGTAITVGVIKAGDIATFRYSGQYHLLSVDRDVDTKYSNATASIAGLMSAADKTKLDGIEEGANKTTLINNFLTAKAGVGAADAKTVADLYSQNMSLANSIEELNASLKKINVADVTFYEGITNKSNSTVVYYNSCFAVINVCVDFSVSVAPSDNYLPIFDIKSFVITRRQDYRVETNWRAFTIKPNGNKTTLYAYVRDNINEMHAFQWVVLL